jgi:hypothetical protein
MKEPLSGAPSMSEKMSLVEKDAEPSELSEDSSNMSPPSLENDYEDTRHSGKIDSRPGTHFDVVGAGPVGLWTSIQIGLRAIAFGTYRRR